MVLFAALTWVTLIIWRYSGLVFKISPTLFNTPPKMPPATTAPISQPRTTRGFIGALVAGWGSDKLFNGNRGPMNLIFAAGILLSVGSLWLMPFASYVMQATCFFTIGFFVFGPQMLIGMAAAECSHKEAAGAATGFVGLFAYLGASLAGWPLAKVLDTWHWSGFFVVISIAAGISALLLLPFLNAQTPREA